MSSDGSRSSLDSIETRLPPLETVFSYPPELSQPSPRRFSSTNAILNAWYQPSGDDPGAEYPGDSSTPLPRYHAIFEDLLHQWNSTLMSSDTLDERTAELKSRKLELDSKRQLAESLQKEIDDRIKKNGRKNSFSFKRRRSSSDSIPDDSVVHSLGLQRSNVVAAAGKLEICYIRCRVEVDALKRKAVNLDADFAALGVYFRDMDGPHREDERVATFEDALVSNVKTQQMAQIDVLHLARARLAIQQSHRWFTACLKVYDHARGGSFAGEDCREYIYQDATNHAMKAQVCWNECARILTTHHYLSSMPEPVRKHYDFIERYRLLGIAKIYKLMYGGRMVDWGVRDSVKLMTERQEEVYKHLTELAVWIQERVPKLEKRVHGLESNRRDVMNRLALAWRDALSGV